MTDDHQSLGDYLKSLEREETDRSNPYDGPFGAVYVRIDGTRFSKFTKGMDKPFDERLHHTMANTTVWLMEEFGAVVAYTQSDEISLVLRQPNHEADLIHSGKFQKIVSRTASVATAVFLESAPDFGLRDFMSYDFPGFDSRAFGVTLDDAGKCILWRWIDARKNAIQMLAQQHFSAKQLHGKHGDAMLEMLRGVGVSFDDYPPAFREGTLMKRTKVMRSLEPWELERIPEAYRPTGPVERTSIDDVAIPNLYTAEGRASLFAKDETNGSSL